jgi:hypothetical protein
MLVMSKEKLSELTWPNLRARAYPVGHMGVKRAHDELSSTGLVELEFDWGRQVGG